MFGLAACFRRPRCSGRHWSVSSGSISCCALRRQARVKRYFRRYWLLIGLEPNQTTLRIVCLGPILASGSRSVR